MYKSSYDQELYHETRFVKKTLFWVAGFLILISGFVAFMNRADRTVSNAIISYEQFQEIYNTCNKINTDLGVIKEVNEEDQMFAMFSKAAMLTNKRQQLARWVEEYNAKSKMWHKSMWKSNQLPYQLDVNQFSNF